VDREPGALREDEEDGEQGGGKDAQLDHQEKVLGRALVVVGAARVDGTCGDSIRPEEKTTQDMT